MAIKISKNFYDWEFIPPEIYHNKRLKNSWFYTPFMVQFAQLLRDRFNTPVFINTYLLGTPDVLGAIFTDSGFRSPESNVGAPLSQHRFKCAIDAKIPAFQAEEIREDIRKNYSVYRDIGLTTIEQETSTWVHGDSRITNQDTLFEVKFYKGVQSHV